MLEAVFQQEVRIAAVTLGAENVEIGLRVAQRRPVDLDDDAVMPRAVEQRVDQGLFLEQLVPADGIEIGCMIVETRL